jgi:hemoglobin
MGVTEDPPSVYAQIGGAPSVKVIVDDLYARVLADEYLSSYFLHIDLGRLKAHLRAFISAAGGGPELYAGRSMSDAHTNAGVTPEHFDRLIGHLADTLTELGAAPAVIAEMGTQLYSLRDEIAPGALVSQVTRYGPGAP